jgi:predicted RNA-binding Zn ribbon-like protein
VTHPASPTRATDERGRPVDRHGRMIPVGTWPAGREAPGRLELVRRLLNTQNLENGAELLGDTAELRDWMTQEGCAVSGRILRADVARVHELRSLLRNTLFVHGSETIGAGELLTRFAESLPVTFAFPDGVRFVRLAGDVDVFLVTVLAAVHAAMGDRTWNRLKACKHCEWVVFDHSKNNSASWCTEKACGSRQRARQYRQRVKQRNNI